MCVIIVSIYIVLGFVEPKRLSSEVKPQNVTKMKGANLDMSLYVNYHGQTEKKDSPKRLRMRQNAYKDKIQIIR